MAGGTFLRKSVKGNPKRKKLAATGRALLPLPLGHLLTESCVRCGNLADGLPRPGCGPMRDQAVLVSVKPLLKGDGPRPYGCQRRLPSPAAPFGWRGGRGACDAALPATAFFRSRRLPGRSPATSGFPQLDQRILGPGRPANPGCGANPARPPSRRSPHLVWCFFLARHSDLCACGWARRNPLAELL